jgi:hypothetical protein
MKSTRVLGGTFALLGLLVAAAGQAQNNQVDSTGPMPVYRVNVVARSMKAINYRHRSGSTKVDFRGTSLMPSAGGDAKVESHKGYIEVDAHFKNMEPASKYGPEYLTYVLWRSHLKAARRTWVKLF